MSNVELLYRVVYKVALCPQCLCDSTVGVNGRVACGIALESGLCDSTLMRIGMMI